jgi:hypothetical protein
MPPASGGGGGGGGARRDRTKTPTTTPSSDGQQQADGIGAFPLVVDLAPPASSVCCGAVQETNAQLTETGGPSDPETDGSDRTYSGVYFASAMSILRVRGAIRGNGIWAD